MGDFLSSLLLNAWTRGWSGLALFLGECVASSSVHFSPYIYLTSFLIFSHFIIGPANFARKKEEENKAKGKEGASSSTLKVVEKGAPKRKVDRKDNHPPKKVSVTPEEKLPKKSLPPKPSHWAGKGLMTTSSPITQEPNHRLLTHKDYVVELIESIIKDKDVDPCAEQMTEELGASGLFDLTRIRLFLFSLFFIYSLLNSWRLFCL